MVFIVLAVGYLVEGCHYDVYHAQEGGQGDVDVEVARRGEGYGPSETEEDEQADDE